MEGSTLETQPSMPWEAAPEMSPEGCDDDLFPPAPELAPICLNERMLRERLQKISVLSCQWQSLACLGEIGSEAYSRLS